MSAIGDDKLRIPIEIKTDDLKELQDVIQSIDAAENDLRSIKPRKGRGTGDTGSRSATGGSQESGFGVFAQITENKPTAIRDKSSKQAIQREKEFDKMRSQLKDIEENQSNTAGILSQFGNILGFTGIGASIKGAGAAGAMQKGKMGASAAAAGVGGAKTLAMGGGAGVAGRMMGLAGKAFLPAAIVIMVFELITTIVGEMFKAGGFFDRRFKRVISDEISQSISNQQKAKIAQGLQVVRVASQASIRGNSGQVTSNLDRVVNNNPSVFDADLQLRANGIIP